MPVPCSHYPTRTGSGQGRSGPDRQNILADKPDRQLSVTVRAGEVPVRCSVNATMVISLNYILSVRWRYVTCRWVTYSVNQPLHPIIGLSILYFLFYCFIPLFDFYICQLIWTSTDWCWKAKVHLLILCLDSFILGSMIAACWGKFCKYKLLSLEQ